MNALNGSIYALTNSGLNKSSLFQYKDAVTLCEFFSWLEAEVCIIFILNKPQIFKCGQFDSLSKSDSLFK